MCMRQEPWWSMYKAGALVEYAQSRSLSEVCIKQEPLLSMHKAGAAQPAFFPLASLLKSPRNFANILPISGQNFAKHVSGSNIVLEARARNALKLDLPSTGFRVPVSGFLGSTIPWGLILFSMFRYACVPIPNTVDCC